MKNQTLQKSSQLLSLLLNVACIIMSILSVLLTLGIIVTMLTPIVTPEMFQDTWNTISKNSEIPNFTQCIIFFLSCLGAFICILFALYNAKKIFSCISKGISPFTKSTASRIRKIALWIIAYAIISVISIFNSSFGSFFISCLFAFILFCISLIFDYGCELQKEVDETL